MPHEVLPKIFSFGTDMGGMEAKLRKCTVSSIADDLLHGELHVAKSKSDYAFYRAEVINFSTEQNQVRPYCFLILFTKKLGNHGNSTEC